MNLETRRLENKFDFLASQFAKFCARFDENLPLKQQSTSKKGKGRGKSSKPKNDANIESEINAAAQKRLQQFLAENDIVTQPSTHSDRPSRSCRPSTSQQIPPNCQAASTSRASINDDLWTEDQSTVSGNETLTETKTAYIKKIECQINQSPLDQVVM